MLQACTNTGNQWFQSGAEIVAFGVNESYVFALSLCAALRRVTHSGEIAAALESAESAHKLCPLSSEVLIPCRTAFHLISLRQINELLGVLRKETNSSLPIRKPLRSAANVQKSSLAVLVALGSAEETAALLGEPNAIESAIHLYTRAIDLMQHNRRATPYQIWNNLGVFHLQRGCIHLAESAFVAALETAGYCMSNAHANVHDGLQSRAAEVLRQSLTSELVRSSQCRAAVVSISLNMSELYMATGALLRAKQIASSILELQPNNIRCLLLLALLSREAANIAHGRVSARKALNILRGHALGVVQGQAVHQQAMTFEHKIV